MQNFGKDCRRSVMVDGFSMSRKTGGDRLATTVRAGDPAVLSQSAAVVPSLSANWLRC
jgi:hypothetical protein